MVSTFIRTAAFNSRAIGVIPARLGATRFPNKPLALLGGVPVICWTWKRASQATSLREVIVAAQEPEIVAAVQHWGGKAELVAGEFRTGSDRVAQLARKFNAPAYVNVQADEPLLEPQIIDAALQLLEENPQFDVTTAVSPIALPEIYRDPNCVKAILDQEGRCLYFSRSPIPAIKKPLTPSELPQGVPFWLHLGLYCFRPAALQRFAELPRSPLEECEGLEQLRLLDNGLTIGAVIAQKASPGIDTEEDLWLAERCLREKGIEYA